MIVIKGGRIIDPKNQVDRVGDLLIDDGKIQMIAERIDAENAKIINAKGKIVVPGFVDIQGYLREPGFEYIETLFSASYMELVLKKRTSIYRLVEMMINKSTKTMGIDNGVVGIGRDADILILDFTMQERINTGKLLSKRKNIPFHGWEAVGRAIYTIVKGRIVMEGGKVVCL